MALGLGFDLGFMVHGLGFTVYPRTLQPYSIVLARFHDTSNIHQGCGSISDSSSAPYDKHG